LGARRQVLARPALLVNREIEEKTMQAKRTAALMLIAILGCSALATAAERPTKTFPLWAKDVPDALGSDEKDIPQLTPYWPDADKATGAAIIVFPGGGYNVLAPHEGEAYARWLNDLGIAAFVLKYRLIKDRYHVPAILKDAARAVRTVRANAESWQLDPARVGIIGSSAGGHLAATLSTQFDAGQADHDDLVERVSSRPDATILCYAFILFDRTDNPERHERFLGPKPSAEQIRAFSPALNVTAKTPPFFIWQTVEDPGVKVENSLVMADALRQAGVPFDLHLYEKGRHGIGLGTRDYDRSKLHPWTQACAYWLGQRGFAAKP
ncbi:MAG TPA: alpha/beta hydrolase, partial [Pirellulales bacterium]|nr:alpha/beta hydrolase [Pirellulales bacterium]